MGNKDRTAKGDRYYKDIVGDSHKISSYGEALKTAASSVHLLLAAGATETTHTQPFMKAQK